MSHKSNLKCAEVEKPQAEVLRNVDRLIQTNPNNEATFFFSNRINQATSGFICHLQCLFDKKSLNLGVLQGDGI